MRDGSMCAETRYVTHKLRQKKRNTIADLSGVSSKTICAGPRYSKPGAINGVTQVC